MATPASPVRLPAPAPSEPEPEHSPSSPLAVQDLYPSRYAHCYGCGRLNPEGLHLRSFEEGTHLVARVRPGEHDTSYPGFAFGGYLASLLDCHSIAAAALASHRARTGGEPTDGVVPFVTASLKLDFVRPTPIAAEVELRARVIFVKGRKVVVASELVSGGQVCVRAEAVAVEMPPSMGGHGQAP